MKSFLLLIFSLSLSLCNAQSPKSTDKEGIENVLSSFMACLQNKDSIKFYSLFKEGPVVWTGVYKAKTKQEKRSQNANAKIYFEGSYERFYRKVVLPLKNIEEKFTNIEIMNDESVASVNSDYSFWEDGKRTNWGKEMWGLVKIGNDWKISSVIFSIELEEVAQEPNRRKAKKN